MADQSVRIESLPDTGAARVGYEMYHHLRTALPNKHEGAEKIGQALALFSACVAAAKGHSYDLSDIK